MIHVRDSSYDEFIDWYLNREYRKGRQDTMPLSPAERRRSMARNHPGKVRDWFEQGVWTIGVIESADELGRLIFLEADWTQRDGLVDPHAGADYRLIRNVAKNAASSNYFGRTDHRQLRRYGRQLAAGQLELVGDNRLTIITPNADECRSNPSGTFYLHDGTGRGLAYATLLAAGQVEFKPVETFVAKE